MKPWTQWLFGMTRVLALVGLLLGGVISPAQAGVLPVLVPPTTYNISGKVDLAGAPFAGLTITYTGGSTTTDINGDYTFAVASGWNGTVSPTRTGYTFSPPNIPYTLVTAHQPAQNYTFAAYTAQGSGSQNWSSAFGSVLAGVKLIIPNGVAVTLDIDVDLPVGLEVQTGGSLDPNGHTVTLTGPLAQTLSGSPLNFYNLTLNKNPLPNTVTISGELVVTNALTITQGTLISASDYADVLIEAAGVLSLTNDITVSGNWTNNGAGAEAFVHNNHKVTFDGTTAAPQTLGGSTTTNFYDLAIALGADVTLAKKPGVDNSVENFGLLSETQTMGPVSNVSAQFLDLGLNLYRGVDISINIPGSSLGQVTVTVLGNAANCTAASGTLPYRNRCFRVTAEFGGNVSMVFYTTVGEDLIILDTVYQYVIGMADLNRQKPPAPTGSWVNLGFGAPNCGTDPGESCPVPSVNLIPGPNSFLIGTALMPPTAVTLSGFDARPAAGLPPAALAGGLALLLAAGMLLHRRIG